jgi:hypothetical protein
VILELRNYGFGDIGVLDWKICVWKVGDGVIGIYIIACGVYRVLHIDYYMKRYSKSFLIVLDPLVSMPLLGYATTHHS